MLLTMGSKNNPPEQSALSNLITTTALQISSSPSLPASLLALPVEILHNLRYQHSWKDLRLHRISSTGKLTDLPLDGSAEATDSSISVTQHLNDLSGNNDAGHSANVPRGVSDTLSILISGQPPRPAYVHPDLQSVLLKHSLSAEKDLLPQREYVIPLSIAQRDVGVETLAHVFDALPVRDSVHLGPSMGQKTPPATTTGIERDGASIEKTSTSQETWQDTKRVLLAMKAQDGFGGDGTVAYYVCLEGEVKPRQNG